MQIKIYNIGKIIAILCLFFGMNNFAYAADISALNFNGDLIGKVIPDGSVINFDNEAVGEVIGHITADGYVLNDDNELIGGIVPQGIAISLNNNILGKVNNDGSVTSMSDSLLGKVLPNGLVVDNNYDVIGAVISSGLVYNDNGNIIGRISGDGKFYNLSGENNGFVTATGHVYGLSGINNKMSLLGRTIPSKMVISSTGQFLGSIAPDGKVIDLKKSAIGNIHANGFTYNSNGIAIGHIVESGYAFNMEGNSLGVVSYNGEVIKKGEVVAQAVFGNRVIGKDGKVIGFTIPAMATANSLDGKYLGRINPEGTVVRDRNIIGKVGASGNIVNEKGEVIGLINQTGPIFDYLGQLKGSASVNGSVISLDGREIGYMQKDRAYDNKEKEIGKLLKNYLNFDNKNAFIGMSGIDSVLSYKGGNYTISPYGYMFNEGKEIDGRNYPLSAIYTETGEILANIASSGKIETGNSSEDGKLTLAGYYIDKNDKIKGKIITDVYATNFFGDSLGYINQTNLVINNNNNLYARILPEGIILDLNNKKYLGMAGKSPLSISVNGDYLGINNAMGQVKKDGEEIGRVSSSQYILDNQGALYGKAINYGAIVSSNCKFLGVVSDTGEARTSSGTYLGMILANNQVINDSEEVIGYVINPQKVSGQNGEIIGVQTTLGTVLNYKNQNLGCQDIYGKIRNSQNEIIGQVFPYTSVMNFDNNIIGYTNLNNKIVDSQNNEIGYVDIEGGVRSVSDNKDIGSLFKYTVAFDQNNTYLGRVNLEGEVVADGGEVIGQVNYDGSIKTNDGKDGYALYDLYVYDDKGHTIGYIAKNGKVYSIMGEMKGSIYYGFVLDKKQNLIARGSRDYDIRTAEQSIIGYLGLDGKVTNSRNIEVGELGEDGKIIDNDGNTIAQALPLQYYHRMGINQKESSSTETEFVPSVEEEDIWAQEEVEEQQEQLEKASQSDDSSVNSRTIGISIAPENETEKENVEKIEETEDNQGEAEDTQKTETSTFAQQEPASPKMTDSQWWQKEVTKGLTVSPYVPTDVISNAGRGGGIGPGGRYNPRRAAMLQKIYDDRRKGLSGKVINGKKSASYTGWDKDWGDIGVARSLSTLRVDMSHMITKDKPIPAVLARSVISLGDAPVTAIVERNIYGDSGRNVIIPAGSRVIGSTSGNGGLSGRFDGSTGGLKVDISWERIIRPDGIAFNISKSQTGDAEGRGGGALGYVDEQLVKKYMMPLLSSVATSAIAYLTAANEDASTGYVETSKQQAANDARANFLERMNDILDDIIKEKEMIQAVTYVPAGTRVIIYPMEDLWLKTYDDIKDKEEGNDSDDSRPKHVLVDDHPDKEKPVQEKKSKPLINDKKQNSNNNSNKDNTGALPPPSGDGTTTEEPSKKKANDGEIDLDF